VKSNNQTISHNKDKDKMTSNTITNPLTQIELSRQLVEAKQQISEWKSAYERVSITLRQLQAELDQSGTKTSSNSTTAAGSVLNVLLQPSLFYSSSRNSNTNNNNNTSPNAGTTMSTSTTQQQEMTILKEELQRRITENQSLHMTIADMTNRHADDMTELKRMLESEEKRNKKLEQSITTRNHEHEVLEEQNRAMTIELARMEKSTRLTENEIHRLNRTIYKLQRQVNHEQELSTMKQENIPLPKALVMVCLADVENSFEYWFKETNTPRGFMERFSEVRKLSCTLLLTATFNGNSNNELLLTQCCLTIGNLIRSTSATFKVLKWFTPKLQSTLDELNEIIRNRNWHDVIRPLDNIGEEFIHAAETDQSTLLGVGHEIKSLSNAVKELLKYQQEQEIEKMKDIDVGFENKQEQQTANQNKIELSSSQTAGETILQQDTNTYTNNTDNEDNDTFLQTEEESTFLNNTMINEIKKWYHTKCIDLIHAKDEAERRLENVQQRCSVAEGRIKMITEERIRNIKVLTECKDAMRKAREELDQTRISYDQQLQLLSSRVLELENELKQAQIQVNNLSRENTLLNKLKQERFFKSQ
jgi:hypothetical protein